jgi:hypothetical protein
MKVSAISSVAFILTGSLLVLVAQRLPLETVLPAIFTSLGFLSVIAGMLVMLGTVVAVMLPYVSHQLDLCQH